MPDDTSGTVSPQAAPPASAPTSAPSAAPPSGPVNVPSGEKPNPFRDAKTAEPQWVVAIREKAAQGTAPAQRVSTPTPAKPAPVVAPAGLPAPTAAVTTETPDESVIDPAVAAPAATMPLTAEAIAAAVRSGIEPLAAAVNAPEPAPGPTDAEIAAQMNVYQATPETFQKMFGVAPETQEQLDTLNDALQGVARQAVTISNFLHQREIQQLRAEIQPYINQVRADAAGRMETEFYKGNADLEPFKPLVMNVYKTALAEGRRFATPADAGKFIADTTRALLKSAGITPAAVGGANGGTATVGTTPGPGPKARTMTPTALGGRGGGPSSATSPKSTAERVFGS